MGFDDLDQDPNEAIRQRAHVANGGEVLQHDCQRCSGSGLWRGHSRSFTCKGCNGTGKVTAGRADAQKGQMTAARNLEAFREEHADLLTALQRISSWHNIAASYHNQVYGENRMLSDRQLEVAHDIVAKVAARRAAKRKEERVASGAVAKSGSVGVERINALFETAMASGLKKPFFRTEHLNIKPAKKDAGILYVLDRRVPDRDGGKLGGYVGKIVSGRFEARREAQPDTLDLLIGLASDPLKAATDYGRATGVCGCCGRELTDPASVKAGIGPVCATKWGL